MNSVSAIVKLSPKQINKKTKKIPKCCNTNNIQDRGKRMGGGSESFPATQDFKHPELYEIASEGKCNLRRGS